MPRPKLPPVNRKTRNIIFRVSEEDYERLSKCAATAGLTVHTLARMLTLSGEAEVKIETYHKADPVLVKRFDRLANNLNQLARNSNTFGRVSPQLDNLCQKINDIICEIAEKELDE